jgi:hypothetical protein
MTLTVFLSLLAGLIDVWKYCKEADTMLTASRYGARAAGAKAQQVSASRLSDACSYGGGSSAVLDAGLTLASNYLVSTGLEPTACSLAGSSTGRQCDGTGNQFLISSQFADLCEGGFVQRVIALTITPKAPRRCLFCFGTVLQTASIGATSYFPAEADCKTFTDPMVIC